MNGETVSLGALSIWSSKPRAEFSDCEKSLLKQFARSIMQHLDSMPRESRTAAHDESQVFPQALAQRFGQMPHSLNVVGLWQEIIVSIAMPRPVDRRTQTSANDWNIAIQFHFARGK